MSQTKNVFKVKKKRKEKKIALSYSQDSPLALCVVLMNNKQLNKEWVIHFQVFPVNILLILVSLCWLLSDCFTNSVIMPVKDQLCLNHWGVFFLHKKGRRYSIKSKSGRTKATKLTELKLPKCFIFKNMFKE